MQRCQLVPHSGQLQLHTCTFLLQLLVEGGGFLFGSSCFLSGKVHMLQQGGLLLCSQLSLLRQLALRGHPGSLGSLQLMLGGSLGRSCSCELALKLTKELALLLLVVYQVIDLVL